MPQERGRSFTVSWFGSEVRTNSVWITSETVGDREAAAVVEENEVFSVLPAPRLEAIGSVGSAKLIVDGFR
jgi:hypothetical protein